MALLVRGELPADMTAARGLPLDEMSPGRSSRTAPDTGLVRLLPRDRRGGGSSGRDRGAANGASERPALALRESGCAGVNARVGTATKHGGRAHREDRADMIVVSRQIGELLTITTTVSRPEASPGGRDI